MSNSPAHLVRNDISESILQTNIINKDLSLNRVWPPSTSTLLTSTASLATNKSAAEFASCFKISLTFERTTGGREEKLLDQKRSIRFFFALVIVICQLSFPTFKSLSRKLKFFSTSKCLLQKTATIPSGRRLTENPSTKLKEFFFSI